MSHYYFDSSGLVKRYVVETGTGWVNSLNANPEHTIQLAAAFELNLIRNSLSLSKITFVCADTALNEAAKAVGLKIENPNDH